MNYQLIIMGSTYWFDKALTFTVIREFLQRYSNPDNNVTVHLRQTGRLASLVRGVCIEHEWNTKHHVVNEHHNGPDASQRLNDRLLQSCDGCLLLWADYSPHADQGTINLADMYDQATQTRIDLDVCKARRQYKFCRAGESWKGLQIG